MPRFRTRPSCIRSIVAVIVGDEEDEYDGNLMLFQTMNRHPLEEEGGSLDSTIEIDNNCSILRRTFRPRGRKKRNLSLPAPITDIDEIKLVEDQIRELNEKHDMEKDFSLLIEMNGQRIRQIDGYHYEPYDENKVQLEKEHKYQEELTLLESKLHDLRKQKDPEPPLEKLSPVVLSSRQKSILSPRIEPLDDLSNTLRTPSPETNLFATQLENNQADEVFATQLKERQTDDLQFTALEPYSEDSRPPTAFDSMLTSTRNYESTVNGTALTRRRNMTQIIPWQCSEGNNPNTDNVPFYLQGYDGSLEDPLDQVLFVVGQKSPIPWSKLGFKNITKLGEGSYGEVFATQYKAENTAVKIVPFNSDAYRYPETVNGEYMLEPAELLPEILISQQLSALYDPTANNSTPNFIRLLGAHVVKGKLPLNIQTAWRKYDEERTSENDDPSTYSSPQQLFLALCLSMGGDDLEKAQLVNEQQIFSVLIQVALSLIIAELELEFEHRDLHHGNLLLEKYEGDIEYRYNRQTLKIKSHGIRVNIIDFSLSSMTKGKTRLYKDLSNDDELFTMEGFYQYQIYRLMKTATANDWKEFRPKTNVYWLHYLANQMINEKKSKKPIKKKRKEELMNIFDRILKFDHIEEIFQDELIEKTFAPYVETIADENVC